MAGRCGSSQVRCTPSRHPSLPVGGTVRRRRSGPRRRCCKASGRRGAPRLPGQLARSGARLDGLRLIDGTLILKIENADNAAQVRVRAGSGAAIGERLALWHLFDPESTDASVRLEELTRLAGEPALAPLNGRRKIDRELLSVLDGRLAGKSWRETAVDLYGAGVGRGGRREDRGARNVSVPVRRSCADP